MVTLRNCIRDLSVFNVVFAWKTIAKSTNYEKFRKEFDVSKTSPLLPLSFNFILLSLPLLCDSLFFVLSLILRRTIPMIRRNDCVKKKNILVLAKTENILRNVKIFC